MITELVNFTLGLFKGTDSSVDSAEKSQETPVSQNSPLIIFKNDSYRLRTEYNALDNENPGLKAIILDVANYTLDTFGKSITITMIFRTDEEQDSIYASKSRGDRSYDDNPWKSPHQFAHSVDLRSMTFSGEEITRIENYINAKYNGSNYYKWTVKNHNVGLGDHFHFQYSER